MDAALDSLLTELNDPDADVRRRAVFRVSAALSDNPTVRAAVLGALNDSVWCVREAAASVVAQLPDADGSIYAPLFALTLRDPSPHVRRAAAAAIGPRIRPEHDYGRAVRHVFERQRIRAAAALGHIASECTGEAVPLLALCLADAHPKVRLTGLRALTQWEPGAVLPLLPTIVRKCAEADTNIASAARDVCLRVLNDPAAELLRPLLPYPGTNDVAGARTAIAALPTAHALRRTWESLPPPTEEHQTAHRFARHLATVCERVLTEPGNPRQPKAP
ncbi:pbs lyase : HEAT repeat protein OS=Nodularia spumigena CCY9414 GN=N9414_06844 PE=4 SV=1: HEAT_2 [Gemmata massiliana]|uniref:Uncharacterized protein n=1 Tax=Gemmata massiliana TaxID=1210884 RepID=A0A6P2DE73_9BACT|nr:HEAT repeat domain-containing protein [Gemmata massiliana]VTR98814.1 pbs lyase : HEAT repeat protein OS=Nodularia spumigena CCY9414 GN=N9414_06844 PE=4 SV=1: HEAT_2 [Gemmata massiliana]